MTDKEYQKAMSEFRKEVRSMEVPSGKVVERYAQNDPVDVLQLAKRIGKDMNVKRVRFEQGPITPGVGGWFAPELNKVMITDDPNFQGAVPAMLMHELSHAQDSANSPEFAFRNAPKFPEGQPGIEHNKGIIGERYVQDYLPKALSYIEEEELGLPDTPERKTARSDYPWLKKVKSLSSNKLPTPWDLPGEIDPVWRMIYERKK